MKCLSPMILAALTAWTGNPRADTAPLIANGLNESAPPELAAQYGRLIGHWQCLASSLQPDGSWKDAPNPATWSWYYILDGHAIQDVWKPGNPQAPMGTNLRTYDPESGTWHMVWATETQARFDAFTAVADGDDIVMNGERWARSAFPAHQARITFHNIAGGHFDWRYEASTDGTSWSEQSRLACDRLEP